MAVRTSFKQSILFGYPICIILPGWREFDLEFGLFFTQFVECPVNSFHSSFLKIKTRQHSKNPFEKKKEKKRYLLCKKN